MKKVTDLEKFALEQIFRPFQGMLDFGEEPLKKLPMELEEMGDFSDAHPEWRKCVADRLNKIDYYFPRYISQKVLFLMMGVNKTPKT